MECNKDEAVRAKQIAEKNMTSNDFERARKIALKAQNLYPELENIKQLLSVCDVHCSAQKRLGSEKDWYGILQVERYADVLTIKKQYRRLALVLHPDKNAFPGAEAAFKLICEAHAVLLDPTKKALFDTKIRATAGFTSVNLPPHHLSRNTQFNNPHGQGYRMNFSNDLSGLHNHQTAEPSFWTSCPFCCTNYQYLRKYVNAVLRCPKCFKGFLAYETSAHNGVPMGSTWAPPPKKVPVNPGGNQTAGFQEREPMAQNRNTMGMHGVKAFSTSKVECKQSPRKKTVQAKQDAWTESVSEGGWAARATGVGEGLKSRGTYGNANSRHGEKVNSNLNDQERATRKRRRRKQVVESSESYDFSSDSDVTINDNLDSLDDHVNSVPSHVHCPRRSTRRRQNVSYREGDDDDDLPDQRSKLSEDNGKRQKCFNGEGSEHKLYSREMGTDCPDESSGEENVDHDKEVNEVKVEGNPIETESDSDRNDGEITCSESEFNDFDKNKNEECFAVNQMWVCYDSTDSMPRFYAKVKKVQLSPFKLSITWLEPDPDNKACRKWRDAGLPISCGRFKLGETDMITQRSTFSHQVCFQEGKKRGSYIIYPKRGEVWALFKDCDLRWSSNPEDHTVFNYEIVEVLTEFDESCGIEVGLLDKVKAFVSLFVESRQSEARSFVVGPNELYKFAHSIPYYKMTGTEREGVPAGAFELDPASLLLNQDDLGCTTN